MGMSSLAALLSLYPPARLGLTTMPGTELLDLFLHSLCFQTLPTHFIHAAARKNFLKTMDNFTLWLKTLRGTLLQVRSRLNFSVAC